MSETPAVQGLFCVIFKQGKKEVRRNTIRAESSMDAYRWGEIQLKELGFEGTVELAKQEKSPAVAEPAGE